MSTASVNGESGTKQDITWKEAIADSEAEIRACEQKIAKLRKSIVFFKQQEVAGVPFPTKNLHRHTDKS